jgi:hypothetical protein
LHAQCGTAVSADRELQEHAGRAIERGAAYPEAAALRLDRCLDAAAQIDRNANQATLIECWLDDLANVGRIS